MNKPTNQTELIAALKTMPSLTKNHFTWNLSGMILNPANKDLLKEVIRINGAAGFQMDSVTDDSLEYLITTISEIGTGSLCMNVSPWYIDEDPPNRKWRTDPTIWDDLCIKELIRQNDSALRCRTIWEKVNKRLGTNIPISMIWTDQEIMGVKNKWRPQDIPWNDQLDAKNGYTYGKLLEIFPEAEIVGHARGYYVTRNGVRQRAGYYSYREPGKYHSVALYNIDQPDIMIAHYKDRAEWAKECLTSKTIPAVGLGGYYIPNPSGGQVYVKGAKFKLENAWQIGNFLASNNDASFITFWPRCFHDQCPNYGLHYIAYVMGWNNLWEDWLKDIV